MSQTTFVFKAIFYEIADENGLVYNASTAKANARLEKENVRARFLVELVEKYGLDQDDLRLDFEPLSLEVLGSVDLVGFKEEKPLLACKFLRNKPDYSEIAAARETLFSQMRDIKALFGVLAYHNQRLFFIRKTKQISEIAPNAFLR